MELSRFAGQNKEELSLVEVAHAILEESGNVYDFTQLLIVIQEYLGLSEEELESKMVRLYTDINIDGRFISLGENRWGLRAWYPIDSIDEEIVNSIDDEDLPRRRRKKFNKVSAFGDDIIDYNEDDPEDIDNIYDEDYEVDEEVDEEDDENLKGLTEIVDPVDEEVEDDELNEYVSDLSEFETDDIEEAEFEDETDDEFFVDEDESEDEEYPAEVEEADGFED